MLRVRQLATFNSAGITVLKGVRTVSMKGIVERNTMAKYISKQNELGLAYRVKSTVKHKVAKAKNPRTVAKDSLNVGLGSELLQWGLTHHLEWTLAQIEVQS